MSERQPEKPVEAMAKLVDSALALSESVAQAVAEATTGRPQPRRPEDTALQTIVRHGATATGSLLTTVVEATRNAHDASAAGPEPVRPALARGETLRMPLSIDNPGSDVMDGIVPTLEEVAHTDRRSAPPLSVAFEPAELTIGPRDFEKLVVLVSAPADAEPGPWTIAFRLTNAPEPPTVLRVDVT